MASKDICYDCYDASLHPLGIYFAKNCSELLQKVPDVTYVAQTILPDNRNGSW